MLLDRYMPTYDFNEVHTIRINATPKRLYLIIKELPASEIALFRTLMSIRALPALLTGRARRSLDWDRPLLDVALSGGFVLLADWPNREIVVGAASQFWKLTGGTPSGIRSAHDFLAFNRPGYAKTALNFHIRESVRGGSIVRTETRIVGLDSEARRNFARYWRVIYPGSALIRWMWLRAIKRRAEQPATAGRYCLGCKDRRVCGNAL